MKTLFTCKITKGREPNKPVYLIDVSEISDRGNYGTCFNGAYKLLKSGGKKQNFCSQSGGTFPLSEITSIKIVKVKRKG